MVRIGDVWDQTTDVLAGRARLLAPVAGLAFFLPFAAQGAVQAYGGTSPGAAALGALVSLLAAVLAVWGLLTVIAMASDPAMTRAEAGALARRRTPAALLVALVAGAVALLATVPIVAALAASGFNFQAAAGQAGSAGAPSLSPGTALFCFAYAVLLLIAAIWASARLFLVNPVVVLERRSLGAFRRSFVLTRGLTWKLIGVTLLFSIVWAVVAFAARAVVFIVFRLLLGAGNLATAVWFGSLADAAVLSAFIVVVGVFGTRLYVARAGASAATPATAPASATGPWG